MTYKSTHGCPLGWEQRTFQTHTVASLFKLSTFLIQSLPFMMRVVDASRFSQLWGLAFGLESAVVAFNRFPALGIAATRRMTLGMCACYFDDQLSLELVHSSDVSRQDLLLMFSSLGAPLSANIKCTVALTWAASTSHYTSDRATLQERYQVDGMNVLHPVDCHRIWKTGRCTGRCFTISFSSDCVAMHSQSHCCNQKATYSSPEVQDKPRSFHGCCIRDLQQVTPSPPSDRRASLPGQDWNISPAEPVGHRPHSDPAGDGYHVVLLQADPHVGGAVPIPVCCRHVAASYGFC